MKKVCRQLGRTAILLLALAVLSACSSQKFLNDDERVLSSVQLKSSDHTVSASPYRTYIRQEANKKWFNIVKVPLGLYCLSGRDSTKGLNRFFRRIGEAPVVFSERQMHIAERNLSLALENRGYLNGRAEAIADTSHKGKARVTYTLHPGKLYRIRTFNRVCDNERIDSLIGVAEAQSLLKIGMACDADLLDRERERIVNLLHRDGYYKILKNFISYEIDSLKGADELHLTMNFEGRSVSRDTVGIYDRYHIRNVIVDVNLENVGQAPIDSMPYRGIKLRYHGSRQFRPGMIYSQVRLLPGMVYDEALVQAGYNNFSNLQALRYTIIRMEEADSAQLDMHITLQGAKANTISAELEGTNISGDLGVASSATFTNRNLFRGSEVWTTKVKAAYEAITGLEGYKDQDFIELSLETHLSFPRIILPFMSEQRRHRMKGESELRVQFDTQERPEFHRRILTGAWSYAWRPRQQKTEHKVDVFSLNYVFMPWISDTFRKEYLSNDNSHMAIVRYSYENLFIMNSAYSYVFNSQGVRANSNATAAKNAYQVKMNVESAGNLLYLLATKAGMGHKDANGHYQVFDVTFAQYVKFDFDYSRSFVINTNNSFAVHTSFGIAQPYGNTTIVPFEKRYFAGGPNSVRGWSVRELGPGSYKGKDGKINFINQTGNLKLLYSMEWRTKMFWKMGGAFFVDAGNVWNTREYAAQPGGTFKWDSFYKEIAVAYGLGLRLNLDYFVLRFDWGMKAVDPTETSGRRHYPILHPKFGRDLTFHFAVGLPF